MRNSKKNVYAPLIMAILTLSVVLASMSVAKAAGTITLTPTVQAPGSSITIGGTNFGINQSVGIGFGEEVQVINETMSIAGPYDVANGPYTGFTSHFPIKPGSFSMSINVSSTAFVAVSPDLGNGTLGDPVSIFINGTLNYVTGQYTRFSKTIVSSTSNFVHLVNYTYYQYNVTPAAGVTTNGAGAFTVSITVPTVANGAYAVTAVDTGGNTATSPLSTVPEGITIGAMLTLTTITAIVSTRYFHKKRLLRGH